MLKCDNFFFQNNIFLEKFGLVVMQVMTTRGKMSIIICDPFHMHAGGTQLITLANLLIIIKGNGFLELKGFLKHDYFACKLTQFTFQIKRQRFGVRRFKTRKGKRNQNK